MNPNPTTGEQIAQQIWANSLSGASREVQFKAAADAINAAIAAEREKREDSHICDLCGGVIKRGKHFCTSCAATQQEQLAAAEQEKPKTTEYAQGWDDHVLAARSQIEDLKDQLAAEQKKVERMSKAYMACNQDWQDVTAQLALIEAHARQLSNIPVEQTYENLAWKDFQQLREQLAAEREQGISERNWSQHLRIQLAAEVEKVNKLQEQLAAEREKVESAEHQRDKWEQIAEELEADRDKWQDCSFSHHADAIIQHLRLQLAAAVEALKLVRKALCSGGGLREATDIIDDALEKIGEKP